VHDHRFEAQLLRTAAHGAAGQYDACLAGAQALLSEAHAAGNHQNAALAAVLLLKATSNMDETTLALEWADVAMQEAVQAQSLHLQSAVWVYRAWPLARQDQAMLAVASMHKGLAMLSQHVPLDERPVLLTSIGLTYRALGLPAQGLVPLRQALTYFSESPLLDRRLRSRDNFIGTVLDAFDQMATLLPGAADALLSEARLMLPTYLADATSSGEAVFTFAYWRAAAAISRRGGDAAQAQAMWLALNELQSAPSVKPSPPLDVEELLERALTARALGLSADAAALARQAIQLLPAEAELRLARELLWASQLAELAGDAEHALSLHKRFHVRVIGNEHAAFEARLDELSTTVEDQSLQLAVANLQRRNAGLENTFQQLSEQALTDALTGAANRRGLQVVYDTLQSAQRPLVLAMIDLDHFKKVNDDHSHVVGDLVLKQTAVLMRQALRDGDVLARYGGEEFTALLVNTPLQEARAVAERLRSVVQAHDWQAVSEGLKVTVSVGLTDVCAEQSLQGAVTNADQQLYRAKHAGRNRVMVAADSLEPDRPHATAA
jgi:diguanylate cyclase (GGDEF)-like protein